VVEALGDRTGLIVVGQSYGGFTAPLVCDRVPADLLVLLAGMVPRPDDWWANTGYAQARREQDERNGGAPADDIALFLHDVPRTWPPRRCAGPGTSPPPRERGRGPLPAWPDVPTRFLLCRDDRFFPADFLRRVVRERLAITPDEIDGSHCVALSRPRALADHLESFRVEL
jgi:hypothetical protein